jgi:hypothetical protein
VSDETDTTSDVARVLREHQVVKLTSGFVGALTGRIRLVCRCGNEIEWPYIFDRTKDLHAEHVAYWLREAGLLRAQIATQEPAGAPGVDSAGRGASGGLGGAPATDWAKVDHTADQCQFEECPSCGCCAHGKEHVIGCSTTLDRPLGTECPNTDCACKGGMG